MTFELGAALGVLAIAGVLCAKVSKLVRNHAANPAWLLVTTVLSSLVWMWMAKRGQMSLAYASVIYDVIYAATYFLALVYLGERPALLQWFGITLAVVGVVLAGLGET